MVVEGNALHLPEEQSGVVIAVVVFLKALGQVDDTEGGVVSRGKKVRNLLDIVAIHGSLYARQGHRDEAIANVRQVKIERTGLVAEAAFVRAHERLQAEFQRPPQPDTPHESVQQSQRMDHNMPSLHLV